MEPSISLELLQLQPTVKFWVQIDQREYYRKTQNLVTKADGLDHITYFYIFKTPFIFLEQQKLQTSNFVGRLTTKSNVDKSTNKGQKGSGLGNVTYFFSNL